MAGQENNKMDCRMKSQGEIEAAICQGMSRFEQDYMGRGPKQIQAHLLGDLLVIRLHGVLTAAEQHLVQSLPVEKGRDLLKQVRTHLIETARPLMEAMVREVTGVKVVSLHHDISTATGEEVVVFTLAGFPGLRRRDGRRSRFDPVRRAVRRLERRAPRAGRPRRGVRPARQGHKKPRPEGGARARQYPCRRRLCYPSTRPCDAGALRDRLGSGPAEPSPATTCRTTCLTVWRSSPGL